MSGERGEERERKHEARARGALRGGGAWLRGTHRPVAVGWKGSSKPFRHYLPFLTCLKECVRAPEWDIPVLWEVRGRRWGSTRHPAVEGPTAACRHLASHWSLISAGGEEEGGRFVLRATEILHIPFYRLIHFFFLTLLPLLFLSTPPSC